MKTQLTLSLLGLVSAQAAIFSTTGGAYIDSKSADSNFSSGSSLVVNSRADTPHYDRIGLYTFDLSSYTGEYDEITLTLDSTSGGTGTSYSFFYFADAVDASTVTWNTAATAGIVPSTADGSVSATRILTQTGSFATTTTTAFDFTFSNTAAIGGDADGLFTIVVLDNDTSGNSNNFLRTSAALTVVPEPTSLALLGLGGLALVTRRKR